jgi:hypothetical protein
MSIFDKKEMMKKIFLILGLLLLTGAVVGYMMWNKPHKTADDVEVFEKLSADDLYQKFLKDPIAAFKLYGNKNLSVHGTIVNFSKRGFFSNPDSLKLMIPGKYVGTDNFGHDCEIVISQNGDCFIESPFLSNTSICKWTYMDDSRINITMEDDNIDPNLAQQISIGNATITFDGLSMEGGKFYKRNSSLDNGFSKLQHKDTFTINLSTNSGDFGLVSFVLAETNEEFFFEVGKEIEIKGFCAGFIEGMDLLGGEVQLNQGVIVRH